MQNFGRFYTTSDFDREYLRKESRYGKKHDRERFLSRSVKKSGELWSTKHRVLHVSLDPLEWTFSGDYISAISGCWRTTLSNFFTLNRDWPSLVSARPNGHGGPPQKSF